MTTPTKPKFFAKPSDLRQWFEKYHATKTELLVGYYKTHTKKASITWSQSVDEALCFGWIDGLRKSIDDTSYTIRFTPRKPRSIWSSVNINKVKELIKNGQMQPAGLAAYEKRDENRSRVYSFEQKQTPVLHRNFETKFRSNQNAWKFFETQPPSYRKPAIHWVMSAKQEATRLRRLDTLIKDSDAEQRIAVLRWKPARK